MTTRIAFGIPHRVGACACQIGKGREEQGVVEATETTTNWENVVANKPLDPGHKIVSVAYTDNVTDDGKNDGVSRLVTSISCWPKYPEQILFTDPQIIFKVKGDVEGGVDKSFPSITITLRPLKTVLNYEYAGNLNASGQGEVGYESLNGADDVLAVNYFEGEAEMPSDDLQANANAWGDNQASFTYFVTDTMSGGKMVTLSETHYFKSKDRPEDEPTPWQPLSGLELDPTFHPRLPSMDAYDFGRNETIDFRYRYPANYLNKYGFLTMPTGFLVALPEVTFDGAQVHPAIPQGTWVWETFTQVDPGFQTPLNPLFQPSGNDIYFENLAIEEGIAPVIKGWYWDSPTPPTNGLKGLFQSTSFKMLKEVRKRYPFSFLVKDSRVEQYRVLDHRPGNQRLIEDVNSAGNNYTIRSPSFYEENVTKQNTFQAIAWWRMEVDAKLCGWNSKKVEEEDPDTGLTKIKVQGAKIKGVIKLGMKALQPGYAQEGLYSTMYTQQYFGFFWDRFTGIAPSFVYRCVPEVYFDENFIQRYYIPEYDAGEILWEVTLDEDNAKGKPTKFLDFDLTSGAELPGQNPGLPGSVPDNSLVFIKEIIVTEVILP